MRALTITRHGPPEVLQVRDAPDPELRDGQIRIRVAFAGINFADILARQGLYPDAPPVPSIVGYEVSGTVEALGAGVEGFAEGDEVLAATRFGGYSEIVCVDAWQARRLPAGLSLEQGAALPVNYLTAHHMIFGIGTLHPGSAVLVHQAAGGVGTAAIQLLSTVPDVTVLGTASPGKHDRLREEGCHHPIDYTSTDYAAEVRRLTDGRGVDLVLDALGGSSFGKGYSLLAPAGRLVMFGIADAVSGPRRSILRLLRTVMSMPKFKPIPLMNENRTVSGVNLLNLWNEQTLLGRQFDALLAMVESGVARPHVDEVFGFEDGPASHRHIEDRKNFGKVLLRP